MMKKYELHKLIISRSKGKYVVIVWYTPSGWDEKLTKRTFRTRDLQRAACKFSDFEKEYSQ